MGDGHGASETALGNFGKWITWIYYGILTYLPLKKWPPFIIHCLGLGHEAMVCAVCLYILLLFRSFQMHFRELKVLYFD